MRAGCFLVVLTIGLIVVGAQGLYEGLTNPSPTVLTYAQFVEQKPTRGWYEVKGCRLDLTEAITSSARITGKIKKAFIPVGPAPAGGGDGAESEPGPGAGQVHLLLATEDEAILGTLNEFEQALGAGGGLLGKARRAVDRAKAKSDEGKADAEEPSESAELAKGLRFLVDNRDRLFIDRDVRGTIQFGADTLGRERRKLGELDANLAPDYVVMEDGKAPSAGASAALLGLGLLIGVVLVRRMASRRPAAAPDAPPAPDAPAGPAEPPA